MSVPFGAGQSASQPLTLVDLARVDSRTGAVLLSENMADQRLVNDEAAVDYLEWLRDSRGRGADTLRSYAGVLAHFLDHCVVGRPFDAVSPQEIEAWNNRPRSGRALGRMAAPATKARNLTIVRGFYTWLTARGGALHNPALLAASPEPRRRLPRPVRDEVWMATYPRLDSEGRFCMGLMFYCGLRRAEVCNLRADQFDESQGKLTGFLRKGGGDDAFPYLEVLGVFSDHLPHLLCGRTPESIASEWAHRARRIAGGGRIVDFPPDGMNHRFERWCGGAFTPHQLRHSFGTNMARSGLQVDMIAWLMNHSDTSTTMGYVRQSGSRLKEWRTGTTTPPPPSGGQRPAQRFGVD